jgi:LasA protease
MNLKYLHRFGIVFIVVILLVAGCMPGTLPNGIGETAAASQTPEILPTPFPTRPAYAPGQLVDYVAQTGDTLPALAIHFNTTIAEIRSANPDIPLDATTMPLGMPMKIPIYYLPFWGTQFKILPDALFVNGPNVIGFDTEAFVAGQPGWLKDYSTYAGGENRSGAGIVDYVAINYSISPRLLLSLLEYQTGALSSATAPELDYLLGHEDYNYAGLYLQLVWAANLLNNGYYGWRSGRMSLITHLDGTLERPDPWQNAATVAFQYYFSTLYAGDAYDRAISSIGFAQVYQRLFGDPWSANQSLIPVSLQQPIFAFPFAGDETWAFTGGPHTGWGRGDPFAAVDFAPASNTTGCYPTEKWARAVADGIVVRIQPGVVMLDLDGDGDERTGWVILYLHVATDGKVPLGAVLKTGDMIGHPSCEGGSSTGTHVHLARKYNGEWIPADSAIPFNFEGWIVHNGNAAYEGTMIRNNVTVVACVCADALSQIRAGR